MLYHPIFDSICYVIFIFYSIKNLVYYLKSHLIDTFFYFRLSQFYEPVINISHYTKNKLSEHVNIAITYFHNNK